VPLMHPGGDEEIILQPTKQSGRHRHQAASLTAR
jgi:hypothetical protein